MRWKLVSSIVIISSIWKLMMALNFKADFTFNFPPPFFSLHSFSISKYHWSTTLSNANVIRELSAYIPLTCTKNETLSSYALHTKGCFWVLLYMFLRLMSPFTYFVPFYAYMLNIKGKMKHLCKRFSCPFMREWICAKIHVNINDFVSCLSFKS